MKTICLNRYDAERKSWPTAEFWPRSLRSRGTSVILIEKFHIYIYIIRKLATLDNLKEIINCWQLQLVNTTFAVSTERPTFAMSFTLFVFHTFCSMRHSFWYCKAIQKKEARNQDLWLRRWILMRAHVLPAHSRATLGCVKLDIYSAFRVSNLIFTARSFKL